MKLSRCIRSEADGVAARAAAEAVIELLAGLTEKLGDFSPWKGTAPSGSAPPSSAGLAADDSTMSTRDSSPG
jgi:hypothetical protein